MTPIPALESVPRVTSPHRRRAVRVERRVLGAELFANLLFNEHRRIDRLRVGESFVLLVLEVGDADSRANRLSLWKTVSHAVMASTRESDVVGWLEHHIRLGVILPGWSEAGLAKTDRLEARARRVLAARLGRETSLRTVSMRLQTYPGPAATTDSLSPLDSRFLERSERRPLRDAVKRTTDIALSAALILAFLPLYLAIALLVKLTSPGPVFFKQLRISQNARPFTMLKFRTMRAESDPTLHRDYVTQFIKGKATVESAGLFKLADDPRVTPIGRLLRRASLDELPQFWNVLVGDMSLVGPRPPLPYEFEQYKPWHRRRVFEAKPGVTGLWQVDGRSRTTFDQMVRLDLQYARTRSFWTDIRILLATPRAMISGKGAA